MWGMWFWVEMTYQSGIAKLIIKSDSKTLVDMLSHDKEDPNILNPIVIKRIRKLLANDWEVDITHTWR